MARQRRIRRRESGEADRSSAGIGGKYRWTCPICGGSNTSIAAREASDEYLLEQARNALVSHVRSTADAAHGGRRSIPAELDDVRLDRHVEVGSVP